MDATVVNAALEGLVLVFSWPYFMYTIAGTLLAMLFSAVPGLSSSTLMALAIPLTFTWDPLPLMLVFGAFVGGATFMGSITAILFNIPGKSQNAVTLLDGYPLTQQGMAKTAIGCAATSSALGSTIGIFFLIGLIPFMREAAMTLGPPEYLMLAIWGLTTLAALSGGSMLKGLIVASLGLLLALIGYDPRTAELRFTFGLDYLHDGLSLVPVFLGVFALAEVIDLMVSRKQTLSGKHHMEELTGSVRDGVQSVFRHFGLFLRSSVIGTVIGAIPGVGSSVAGFVAYGHARQAAGRTSRFGRGDIRGILAPEAANDAKDGGALVPTLALGIPGGTGTAVLLGALTIHGMSPGREMLTDNLVLVFVLIWSLFLSNWITSLLGLSLVNPMARLSTIRTTRLLPFIIALSVIGCLQYRGLMADVMCAVLFGLLGYLMKRHDWPRIPLAIAIALAPLFEANLHLTLRLHELDRIVFWTRPLVLVLIAMTLLNLFLPAIFSRLNTKRQGQDKDRVRVMELSNRPGAMPGFWRNYWSRNRITIFLGVVTCIFLAESLDLGRASAWVPQLTLLTTLTLIVLLLGRELRGKSAGAGETAPPNMKGIASIFPALGWIGAMLMMVWLLGVSMGLMLFCFGYLRWYSNESWSMSGVLACGLGLFIQGVFGLLFKMPLYQGVLSALT